MGQDATTSGQVLGLAVSLFDVADLADPTLLSRFTLSGASSEAEGDPHAFLYWPRTGMLVVPLDTPYGVRPVPDDVVENGSGSGGDVAAPPPADGPRDHYPRSPAAPGFDDPPVGPEHPRAARAKVCG